MRARFKSIKKEDNKWYSRDGKAVLHSSEYEKEINLNTITTEELEYLINDNITKTKVIDDMTDSMRRIILDYNYKSNSISEYKDIKN